MTLTHDELKTLFKMLYQQQEDLSILATRLATCERALQDVAALQQPAHGPLTAPLNGAEHAGMDSESR